MTGVALAPVLRALGLLAACGPPADSVAALQDQCQDCHPSQARALAEGVKATAADAPLFQALRAEAEAALGPGASALCDRCHTPEVGTDHGLSCATCHAAVGHQAPENGLLIFDLRGPVRGPTGQVDPRAPHASLAGGLANDSALCGTCHDVSGLVGFEERPYAHWTDSPAAEAGVGCVDCHMSPVPGEDRAEVEPALGPAADLEGLEARALADHRFVGLNADPAEAVDLLARAASLELWIEGEEAVVRITNHNAGHPLPDGASFLRELWVEAWDERGLLAEPTWLSTRLRLEGQEVASPILADAQVRGAIEPLEHRELRMPRGEGGVRACLRFRAIRPDLLEHLGLDPELAGPTWEVACAQADDDEDGRLRAAAADPAAPPSARPPAPSPSGSGRR